jgi:alanine racemase
MVHRPLRLLLDGDALVSNWRWLNERSGDAACGAAVKADGYGLGAREVVQRLAAAGCRDFFVATWAEAAEVEPHLGGASLSVLHGLFEEDMPAALASIARPVLNTAAEVACWRSTGRPCDVMIDTGIHRLGLTPEEVRGGILHGLQIETLHSHLACADEDVAANHEQRRQFEELSHQVTAARRALSNSAGICLGADYRFDLTRPGLALYGGIPRAEAAGHIRQVARIEAQVIQRRRVAAGGSVGYNATWTAEHDCELAILNIGYADGYLRGFSGRGHRACRRHRAAGRRARVDGSHRRPRRRGAARGRGRLDGDRLRPSSRLGAIRPQPIRTADHPRLPLRTGVELAALRMN